MIRSLNSSEILASLDALVELLKDSVDSGASVGFLPPLELSAARAYWEEVREAVSAGNRILLVAEENGMLAGSVQLDLAVKPNALHRAEVIKLMVHTNARRRGIGRALMQSVEESARRCGRTLLVLDTRRGDDAEKLYRSLGWVATGIVPRYARNAQGKLDDTVFFYRELDPPH